MPYIIKKTNGTTLTTIDDAALDTTTDLSLVGKNYSGYGQVVNQNFVKLLENFNSSSQPANPIQGQLWFNNSTKALNVYDGIAYKGIANVYIQGTIPKNSAKGDLWWDTVNKQLKSFDGSVFVLVGPPQSSAYKSSWTSSDVVPLEDPNSVITVLKGLIGTNPAITVANQNFTPSGSDLDTNFDIVKKGVTLPGADARGSTTASGYYFWGTAAEALYSNTATVALSVSNATTATTANTIAQRDVNGNLFANTFIGIASSSRYADLAERYEADAVYDVGTVLVIGGEKEVTVTDKYADTRVVGVVSINPAYMMNSEAGNDETHPYIALKGRVPCKVIGTIAKGDLLITSGYPGYATVGTNPTAGTVIGKALGSQSEGFGVIEVLVV
jgi:hypothetical protein